MNIISKSINAIKRGVGWVKDIYANRKLIVNLANKDFKMRYAASYLGTFWAFVQPVVTVTIYVFVFQFGLRAAPVSEVPYALWLIAGMVPWLFIFEALTNATNSLLEYSYLVKKVIFKISILPIVKIITALYVHLFFIGIGIAVYYLFGYTVDIYIIQVLYYSFAATILVLGISYFTSSVVIFFRDLAQVINIVLQFLMWLTPILWSLENVTIIPVSLYWVFKLNPIYYITEGYRDAFINGVWFWEKPTWTIYFWCFTIIAGLIGTFTFKRLEKHFADVL